MNGEDQGPNLSDFQPSWMKDGQGIYGAEGEPDLNDFTTWDIYSGSMDQQSGDSWSTKVTSSQNQAPPDDVPSDFGNACLSAAGDPPGSGTSVLGSVDGVCQWIDTTTCS